MTYYRDLDPCDYFDSPEQTDPVTGELLPGTRWTDHLRAVGWLDGSHPFATGVVAAEVRGRLAEFLQDPWQPCHFMGRYFCLLCINSGVRRDVPLGSDNIFVPGRGCIYVAPELILHYIEAHNYCPPKRYLRAVRRCPPFRGRTYARRMMAKGPKEFRGFEFAGGFRAKRDEPWVYPQRYKRALGE